MSEKLLNFLHDVQDNAGVIHQSIHAVNYNGEDDYVLTFEKKYDEDKNYAERIDLKPFFRHRSEFEKFEVSTGVMSEGVHGRPEVDVGKHYVEVVIKE